MKNEKMLKVAKEYKNKIEEIVDYIKENGKEIFAQSYEIWNGWNADVVLTQNSKIEVNDFSSNGSMSMAQYNGEEITVAVIKGGRSADDYNDDEITWDEYVINEFELFIDNLYDDIERHLNDYINYEEEI